MNERLKELRNVLNLSQDAFGNRIGMSGGGISLLEKGKRNITEQVIKSICREYNVDYMWLTTGNGEMFINNDDTVLTMIDNIMAGENDFHKNLLKACASLDMDDLKSIEKLIDKFLEIKKAGN